VVTEVAFMLSLKVAVIFAFVAIPVALLFGNMEVTLGKMVSSVVPVVNDQVYGEVIACPSASLTPVVRVAVYRVELAS
jgi:hypothetical protein